MFAFLTFGLALASMVLHFIAPRTANKVDDKLADGVDQATKLLPILKGAMPEDAAPAARTGDPTPPKMVGFGKNEARDHR